MDDDCPSISVVIGAQEAAATIERCVQAVLAQTHGLHAEIIVADGSTDGTAALVASRFPDVVLIRGSRASLVPHLWGLGIERVTAPLVAVTMAQCIPAGDWLEKILRAVHEHPDAAALGGPIDGPHDGAAIDWAVYFARYSAHMPPGMSGPVRDIAGDNAAYRRDALQSAWLDRANGFWETLVHHTLRADGKRIYAIPAVRVRLAPAVGGLRFARIRFQHGQHFGSTRTITSRRQRALRIVSTPALPAVLLYRIGRSVRQQRPDWMGHYLRSLPWLIMFLIAWSLGEARGYAAQRREASRR